MHNNLLTVGLKTQIDIEVVSRHFVGILSTKRLPLHDEKQLQNQIESILLEAAGKENMQREYRLDAHNIVDFFINGIGIEIKLKAPKRSIFKQCERYCKFDSIKNLILVTNTAMGFPAEINGKSCFVVNLGKAWL